MKTEVLTYQKVGGIKRTLKKGNSKSLLGDILYFGNLILIPTAFLLGRASIGGGLLPFGMAVYTASAGLSYNRFMLAIAVLLGMASGGGWEQLYITASAMLLFNVILLPFKGNKSKMAFTYAIAGFISVIIPETVMVSLQGFLLFDALKALFHGFIVFALSFIFRNVTSLIGEFNRRNVFSNEEMISMCITGAIALSGFGEMNVFGFGFKNILSILLILVFGYKCGAGVGSAVGLCIGLIISMSSPTTTPLVIGCYGFCGLLAGLFAKLGKTGSSLGFIMGNIILTLYLNGSIEALIYLKEIVVSVSVFLLMPNKYIDAIAGKMTKTIDTFTDKRSYSMRIKEMTIEKLNKFSRAFEELSKTFREISETRVVTDKNDISGLFDRVADRVCKDCSLCMYCWDKNFYNTYQVMFKIIEELEEKGRIESQDIPEYFMERCERIDDFVDCVNNIYELFKVDMVWKNKIGESRGLVSQQLDGLARVIANLAKEINLDVHFKTDIEDLLILELIKSSIKVSEVLVLENKFGKFEISVFHKGCNEKRICVSNIEKIISQSTGRKMTRNDRECHKGEKGGGCVLKFVEEEKHKITTGISKAAKYDTSVSGDSYTFMNTGDGKFMLALSDGMGSGPRAATQSRAAIGMLEQFMESGFDKETAIRLINSILVLKSSDDSFATIDLSVVDLFNGEVEFIKIGAIPTYIKRKERVEMVKTISLPAGILSNIETEMLKKQLENGDFIVMLSDGILDAFKNKEEGEKSLQSYIENIGTINPQEMADNILDEAVNMCNGRPSDDMLVVVAKLWGRVA